MVVEFASNQLVTLISSPVIGLLVTLVFSTMSESILLVYVGRRALGQNVSTMKAVSEGSGLFGRLLLVNLIASTLFFVGMLLCVAPGLFVNALLNPAVPLALLERRSVGDALKVSASRIRQLALGPAVGFTSVGLALAVSGALGNFVAAGLPHLAKGLDENVIRAITFGLALVNSLLRPVVQLQQLSLWAATRPAPAAAETSPAVT